MLCPKCGQVVEETESLCPICGADLKETAEKIETPAAQEVIAPVEKAAEAETPETEGNTGVSENAEAEEPEAGESEVNGETGETEETAETEETDAEEVEAEADADAEEVPAEPEKKKSKLGILMGAIIALLVLIIVCLGFALNKVSKGESLPSISSLFAEKFHGDRVGMTITDESGATVAELTNSEYAFYFWNAYFSFVNNYGYFFDITVPLEEQVYEETTDEETGETITTTWKDFFLDSANYGLLQTIALKTEAEAKGFELPEEYRADYDSVMESLETYALNYGFSDAQGDSDVLAYVQDSYGAGVTLEQFKDYILDSYYVSAYSDYLFDEETYSDTELSDYMDQNASYFMDNYGIEKTDSANINVRHILIEPEADENGEISDEAWEEAEKRAQEILKEWEDGDATEDSFAELATANSADGGSSANGGLYEDVYPGQMVESFNDWCFEPGRKTGDTGIVKTDFGYHIMFFVSTTENYYWKDVVESELRYNHVNDTVTTLMNRLTANATDKLQFQDPTSVIKAREQQLAAAAEAEAEPEAAADSATESAAD